MGLGQRYRARALEAGPGQNSSCLGRGSSNLGTLLDFIVTGSSRKSKKSSFPIPLSLPPGSLITEQKEHKTRVRL